MTTSTSSGVGSAASAASDCGARRARVVAALPCCRPPSGSDPRRPAACLRRAYSGSRSFQIVRSGAAKKIEEYAPEVTPTMSANAKSFSVEPPRIERQMIGSSVMNVVASERRIVSHSETLAIVANG